VLACAIALNVLLNWIFIFGHLGMPAMGVTGAGMATMLSNACFTVAIIVVVSRTPSFGLRFREVFRPAFTRKQVGQLADLGLPTSAQIAMEIGAFVFAAFMIGRFGAASLAAHHVTVQIAAFSFHGAPGHVVRGVLPRGAQRGAADMAAARRIGLGAFVLTAAWMVFAGLTILSFRRVLAAQFSSDPVVLDIAVQFLAVAAMFQIFDGLQTVAIGGLRGLRDTRVPTVAVGVCYWLLALPLAWFIGFHHNVGPLGVWAALAVGLALVAISMLTRFAVIASRPAKSQGNAKG
jgi:MATE family multidrug resistance protein